MAWAVVIAAAVGAAGSAYASKQQNKAAKAASQPKTTTSSPYMAERLNPVIPYLMSEQQKVYENRMRGYGLNPGDFSSITAQLAGIGNDYSGVGTYTPQQQPLSLDQWRANMAEHEAYMAANGITRGDRRPDGGGGVEGGLRGAGFMGEPVDPSAAGAGPDLGGMVEYWK